ncbi:MAG: hypothetical protein K5745_03595 [Saccharofermentans sp.]|nr:hypothetical protein [Saccharofermentans sp.]
MTIYWITLGVGALISFLLTYLFMAKRPLENSLIGHDRGRKFAEGAQVNVGKPTGVGVYFITVFTIISLIAVDICYSDIGVITGILMVFVAMITGLLDDRSKKAWNEYIKGGLDFGVAILAALAATFCLFDGEVVISLTGYHLAMNKIVFFILAVILFIVSINATNATDGIDGLSATLSIFTIIALTIAAYFNGTLQYDGLLIGCFLIMCLLAYLKFNFFPSKVLMGDAGSRGLGVFIAFYAIYLNIPFAYLIVGLPFLLDGGISVLKITVGRLTKKKIILFKNILTPFHEELKKKRGMKVPQVYKTITIPSAVLDTVYAAAVMIILLFFN